MIVSYWFEADDMALAGKQHDDYWSVLQILVQCLVHRVDDLAPELPPFLPIETYDHCDLQWLHDLLAARFRLAWLREHKTSCKQVTLFGEDEFVEARDFAFEWHNAIQEQLEALLVSYPNTVRYVLISVLLPNPDKRGIGAEDAFFRDVVEQERKRLSSEAP
ncbi:hypothetical protein [Halomonas lysinitropha]|uniref:Uncharacterized protein n=1 Tax=Halomonas lysinitropha TaxID=2607506 RepID=A0A5K1I8K4_9GAMM|nr:hypothetical protein [Halomonas lysinitropha]VVZ96821.1 hypothetical protein HALO32_02928 [Halomonas lysinitropha]